MNTQLGISSTARRKTIYSVIAGSILFLLSFILIPETLPDSSSAESGVVPTPSLTFSGSHAISLTVNPGQFGTSDTQNLVVETTNYTGYTMSIAPSTGNSTDLVNTAVNTYTIPSIASTTTLSSFQALSTAAYGLSTDNGTTYLPITNGGELYSTNAATDSTTGGMTIKLGAKAISSTPSGDYTKAFTLTATANAALYNIIFDANAGEDTVTNMPTGATLSGAEIVLPFSPTPTRAGYLFLGWDTNQNATTPAYTDGGTIRLPIDPELDQSANTRKLYAIWRCGDGYICYDDNGADEVGGGKGSMKPGLLQSSAYAAGAEAVLVAPNYSKTGYAFVGWSATRIDPVVTSTNTIANIKAQIAAQAQANPRTIYGPNETITMPDPQGPKQLYAVWLPAEKDNNDNPVYLQGWTGCSTTLANTGDVIALTDSRDNDVYAIAKLADGNCWMIENLRLDYDANITPVNTQSNNGAFGGVFAGLAEPEFDFINGTTPNSLYTADTASTDLRIITGSNQQYRFPRYNNSNTASRAVTVTSTNNNIYSYGNYYTWAAAIADTDSHIANNQSFTSTSICPSGWRLPRGGEYNYRANSDWWNLVVNGIMNGVGPADSGSARPKYTGDPEGSDASKALRSYPTNLIYSGVSLDYRGERGDLVASTVTSSTNGVLVLRLNSDNVYPGTMLYGKQVGFSVRCLAGTPGPFTLTYDANGGDSTSVPDSQSATANGNYTFTVSSTIPTRTGYTFAGWMDERGVEVPRTQVITGDATYIAFSANVTLYARWTNNTCNSVATTIGTGNSTTDAVCLQDVNSTVKSNMIDKQTYTLKDARDNQSYTVSKLDDGNVWMTQNLNYGSSNDTLLTPYDTDLPSGLTFKAPASTTTFERTATDAALTNPKILTDNTYGGYYSYAAAIASVTYHRTSKKNITTSICPAGWDLPTSAQYDSLRAAANLIDYNAAHATPYNFTYAGYKSGTNNPTSQTSAIRLWTSTNYDYRYAYYTTSYNDASYSNNSKLYGESVRCIASNGTATILYDANGGTGTMTNQNNIDINATVIQSNSFTAPDNMSFKEWCTDASGTGGTCVAAGALASAVVDSGQTVTLYAIWKNNLTIIYHGNGHTSGTDLQTQSIPSGTSAYLKSSTIFTRTNYTFTKWCTEPDGSGTCYNASSSYTVPSDIAYGASVDLYAQWVPYLTIRYYGNGQTSGTSPQTQTINAGATDTLKSNTTFTKTNYSMTTWNTKANGSGTSYAAGSSFTAPADTQPGDTLNLYAQWFIVATVVYNANGGNCGGSTTTCMDSITHTNVDIGDTFDLFASNYSKTDYGFAGWSTDSSATVNGNSTIYGPNETIEATASFLSNADANRKITLYAIWVPKDTTYTLQTFAANNRCDTMSANQVIALGDARDSNVYTVGKLADGNCWMMENLRLDTAGTQGSAKEALSQGYGGVFTGLADPEAANNFSSSPTSNTLNGTTLYSTSIITGANQGFRFPRYNNSNTSSRASAPSATNNVSSANSHTDLNASIYSYGNCYTWAAAVADTADYTTYDQSVTTTSLCPTGWHLPTGGSRDNLANSDWWTLTTATVGAIPANYDSAPVPYYAYGNDGYDASKAMRHYPTNLLYSGHSGGSYGLGSQGSYWSSTVQDGRVAYDEHMSQIRVDPGTVTSDKIYGRSIRCVASLHQTLTLSFDTTKVASVEIDGTSYSTNGATISLAEGSTHTIDMTFQSGYEFDNWSVSGTGSSVASASTQSTTITMGSASATLTANAKAIIMTFDRAFAAANKTKQNGYYTMQDMNANICDAVATGQTGSLIDTRDNTVYTVAKLVNNDITPAYSECWMTQSMRLDFSSSVLTSQTVANLEAATNNPASGFWAAAQGAIASNSGFDSNNYDVVKYSKINIGDNTTDSTDHTYDEYGIYYNWYTATAGHGVQSKSSGNADGDLCPNGWHLPTGGAGGEFGELNNAVNNGSSSSPSGLLASPAGYLFSGFFIDANANGRGSYASYWSSTADGYGVAYDLYFGGSYVYPGTDSDNEYGGQAVRCLADNTPAESNQQSNEPQNSPQEQSAEPQATPSAMPSAQSMSFSAPANAEPTDAEDQTEGMEDSEATSTAPLGVKRSSDDKTNAAETVASVSSGTVDESDAFGLIALVGAGVATTSGLLLLAGKRRKDDEEDEPEA